jgi:hypothetical protein
MFAVCAMIGLSAGCGDIKVPDGYVSLEYPGRYNIKAVSARGNRFAMTTWDNERGESANLAYWTAAVEYQKVEQEGYRLDGREKIKTDSGTEGVLFDLRVGSGAAEYTYLLAVFVTPTTIYTVEAGGPTAQIGPDREKLMRAIKSLRT